MDWTVNDISYIIHQALFFNEKLVCIIEEKSSALFQGLCAFVQSNHKLFFLCLKALLNPIYNVNAVSRHPLVAF